MAIDIVEIPLRSGTTTDWANSFFILARDECGYDRTLGILKFGDGVHRWVDLPLFRNGPILWSEITGKPPTLTDGQVSWEEISDKPATFPADPQEVQWAEVENKPTEFPAEPHTHGWGEVTDKPSTFPPQAHSHDWAEVNGKPATFPPSAHAHSEYAPVGHTHSEYAPAAHTHTGLMTGTAQSVPNATGLLLINLTTDFNNLLAKLRSRGVIL